MPELNSFITDLNGEHLKMLIISLFTISAAFSRPFSGRMADISGRKPVMYIGVTVCAIVTALYPFCGSIAFFLLLRFLHGFSTGFLPTGATALVTDLLPADKRGEGMGIFGTAISLGIGVGQSLGSLTRELVGMNGLFFTSVLLSVISGLILYKVRETLESPKKVSVNDLKIKLDEIYEPNVIPVGIVMFLSASTSGMLFVLSPDMSDYLGISNRGHFFLFYVISTIFVRLFTGKLSDKIGRRETLIIGGVLLITSMLLLAYANTYLSYTISSLVFGMATGINSPTLFAWMADRSPAHRRGIGSGTLFIALELGIFFGSLSTYFWYDSTADTVKDTFLFATLLASLSLLYILWHLFMFKPKRQVHR